MMVINKNQLNEEKAKRDLRSGPTELGSAVDRLEDHPILRGTLAAFDLDASIVDRAKAFGQVPGSGVSLRDPS